MLDIVDHCCIVDVHDGGYLYTGTQSLSHVIDPYRYESEKLNNGFYLEQYHMTEFDGILHDP